MDPVVFSTAADELSALRRLYPGLSDEELREVQETLDRYTLLVARIIERIWADPEAYAELLKRLEERCKGTAQDQAGTKE